MKKLFSLLTVLFCAAILSTSAFAADDAYSVYQKYLKKSKSIKSMELAITEKISMAAGDQSVDLTKQSGTAKIIMTADNKMQMETKISDSATKEIAYGYFKDNYLYTKAGNEKFKVQYAANDALFSSANVDNSLTKDDLKDAKIEKVDEGIKITYKIKASDLDSAMAPTLKSLEAEIPNGFKMSFTSMTISMIIANDGTLVSTSNSFGINLSDGKDTFKIKALQKMKVKSVNSITKINFPSDLNTYKTVKAA